MDNHKQTTRWSSMGHVLKYYGAAKRLGCPVDVITEEKDFSRFPFLIAPACQLVDDKLVARWKEYAENGGHLVLTCRTAQKDRRGQLWEGPWAAPILPLIGAKITAYDDLPEPFVAKVSAGAKTYDWASWGEQLLPTTSETKSLAQYADQFYAGKSAAVTRRLGKGTVTYIGVDTLGGDLETDLLRGVLQAAGVTCADYDAQLFVDWRDGFWVATNFTSKDQSAPVPASGKLLLGPKSLPPGGVAVWTE
jgi:beta-galactosidase